MKEARINRYNLLTNYCRDNSILYLFVAHHKDDQIETFLIRLSRGSGVQGLSSMKKVSKINSNIKIEFEDLEEDELKILKENKII